MDVRVGNAYYFGQRTWEGNITYWLITSALEPETCQALLFTKFVTYNLVLLSVMWDSNNTNLKGVLGGFN